MPKGKPLNNDNEIRTKNDDFWVGRILKFTLLVCAVVIIVGLTALLCYKLIYDEPFRNGMADMLKQNATGIIIGVSAVLGVNLRGVGFKRNE